MNINDIDWSKFGEPPRTNIWADLMERQWQLHEKYGPIETKSGIGYGVTVGAFHMDKPTWQYLIKDLMWRFHEEVAEAIQAQQIDGNEHYREELIDALHFLLELNGVIGYIYPPTPYFKANIMEPSFILGLAANQLKNKPWKQDFKETDIDAFFGYMGQANSKFWSVLYQEFNQDLQTVWKYYMAKHKVNEFRIESKY